MSMLVTLQEAADHLRIDDIESVQNDLTLKIHAASESILNYIEMTIDDFGDSDSDGREIPYVVKAGVLLLLGDLYRYTDTSSSSYKSATLPDPIRALLYDVKTWGLSSD
jgi:hypothetical protein